MSISHLQFIDWVVIAIYFIAVLGIGLYARQHARSGDEYFIAGRRNSTWIAGIAFLSANMGALELLGMAGQAYKYGIMPMHFYLIGAIPAMLFLGVFMMPFYYSSRIHSIPGYLRLRFNEATRTLNALSFAVMTLLMSGINLYAMAKILNIFVGWPMNTSIYVSSLTIAIYIGLGGLTSAIFSEVLQFFLIWFGLLLAIILGFIDVGGWHQIIERIPENYAHLWQFTANASHNPLLINWIGIVMGLGFVLSFGYWTTDFLVVQRAISAKDQRAAQMAPILASYFKMFLPIIVIVPGLLVLGLVKAKAMAAPMSPDNTLLVLLEHYYPPGLLGLGVTALLAGFMAGQAGNVSAFNTVFTYDLYRSHLVKNSHDAHYVLVGRIATIVGILLSIVTAYWAMHMPTIMEYMQALFSVVNAPLFATIALGMFWRRINGKGAFWGLLIGMGVAGTSFVLSTLNIIKAPELIVFPHASDMGVSFTRAIWAWALTFILTIVISLMSKAPTRESLDGLVYGHKADANRGVIWYKKPSTFALVSLLLLIVINVIFW